ncbi:site-2 protease family protein [Gloeobacter kilaueensis]|uniref:Peptidase M50 n=1 Tax=Gloeobacter kilaueensis (strain ATCC BAA-2537 / CCAP 1431/1 / ULC 316 / JS1) TaxID=1183438 RepID=U5QKP4_GLOK1|nr:site-2 protease family protein [Gloeobacter kilaueensis]AGY59552.1 peptidase M50 [Gloeobacter kilaueensis JS1]
MNTSALLIPTLLILGSFAFLGWGFVRARRAGRVGILAWLQAAILYLPWIGLFALFWTNVQINFGILIVILIATTGGYIWVGRLLRAAASDQEKQLRERYRAELEARRQAASDSQDGEQPVQPSALLLELEEAVAIPDPDREQLQGIFGIDTFFATESVPFRQGILYKGNLRGETELVFRTLSEKLHALFGERYQLYLLADEENRPTVLVMPTERDPFQGRKVPAAFTAALLVLMFLAVLLICIPNNVNPFSPAGLLQGLPMAGGVLFTLFAHEVGHRWQAKRYGVRLSAAFFLPLLTPFPVPPSGFAVFPGTFGSLTRIDSPPPSRRALFDIAFAGPAVGGLVSLAFLLVGLLLSSVIATQGPLTIAPDSLNVLAGILVRVLLGPIAKGQFIDLHPFAVIGLVGLQITALSLLPAGQLDGGRIVQAVYGRRTARITGIVALVLLGFIGLFVPQYLYWAVVVLLFARTPERPCLNELSETDSRRDALAILALFAMAAILLPLSPQIALRLGLGG